MSKPKPPDFGTTRRLQREYEAGLRRVAGRVLAPKRPEQTFEQWRAQLAERSRQPDVQTAADFLARQMYRWANVKNAKTWREAARRTGRSSMMYRLLTAELQGATGARVSALIRENARLITSVSLGAADTLTGEIAKAQQEGLRPEALVRLYRRRFPELLSSRIKLIGRTETSKASTALTRARCEELNLDFYVWISSDDERVRKSHKNLNGVLVPWAHAPSPEALVGEKSYGHYHSGSTFNCRCSSAPLLTYQDVTWPHRVYWNGVVKHMNLGEFKRIAQGVEDRAA